MNRPLPERGNVCGIVVTYQPDAQFTSYLSGIGKQCSRVVIVDNGSNKAILDMLRSTCSNQVSLWEMGRNTGLGVALNHGISEARSENYPWVLLFDQDSLPLGDMTTTFAEILTLHSAPDRIALIGSAFIDRNRQAESAQRALPSAEPWREKRRVITSGMLLATDAYERIGPFREDFFIDTIDHEYCERAQRQGWRILQATTPLLSHSVGHFRRHRLLGFDVWRSHHSALRCYFKTRNPMLLARESHAWTRLLRGGLKSLKNAFLVLLFEEDKRNKIMAMLAGYRDGVCGRSAIPELVRRQIEPRSEGAQEG